MRTLLVLDFDRTLTQLFADEELGILAAEMRSTLRLQDLRLPLRGDPYAYWNMIRKLATQGNLGQDVELEQRCRAFLTKHERLAAGTVAPFEGVLSTITSLCNGQVACRVLTSNDQDAVQAALSRWGGPFLNAPVHGRQMTTPLHLLKPNAAPLVDLLQGAGVSADAALYVGDSLEDAECARAAEVAFVGVLTGSCESEELLAAGALTVLDSVAKLTRTVLHDA